MTDQWSILVFDEIGEILGEFDVESVPFSNYPDRDFVVRIKVIPGQYLRTGKATYFEIFIGDVLYATRKYNGETKVTGQQQYEILIDIFEKDLIVFKQPCCCSCGSWSTYGKDSKLHADWCDVK